MVLRCAFCVLGAVVGATGISVPDVVMEPMRIIGAASSEIQMQLGMAYYGQKQPRAQITDRSPAGSGSTRARRSVVKK